jgi:hypothetical protein
MRHQGEKDLKHDFDSVWKRLKDSSVKSLRTPDGNDFDAIADQARKGESQGEKVIRIKKNGAIFALIYSCCWGHTTNHYGTRIGGYCEALDQWVDK